MQAMERSNRFLASLTEAGRYQLLIEAVTDYAIYMLDPMGIVTSWNPGAQRFKGYAATEIIGQHFSRFYTEEDQKDGLPARALESRRRVKASSRTRAGEYVRMVPVSGLMSLSMLSDIRRPVRSWVLPRSPAI